MSPPDLFYERQAGVLCAGVDEVGRGCLAGPVVAAAVILPSGLEAERELGHFRGLDDSKKLTADKRAYFHALLLAKAICAVGLATVLEIESVNILQASLLAMRRAVAGLSESPQHLLVDGKQSPDCGVGDTCLVGGDGLSLSIAAASVLAKHHRDSLMRDLAKDYPDYDWHNNKGYGTRVHRSAILTHGLTPQHRQLFCRKIVGFGSQRSRAT